jgi:rhodanese-related sulfurtransferase
LPLADAADVDGGEVLDVRQADEYAAGHLPGARHVELGALAATVDAAPATGRPVVVMCGHGERAMGAASVLARAGHQHVSVLLGGPAAWSETSGEPLETGR